jgi:hypothetical protein
MRAFPLSLAVVFLLSACQQNGSEWRSRAFQSSATYRRIVASGHTPAFLEDAITDHYMQVGAGVSTTERFDRWATLRLFPDGHAERSVVDASGEEVWILDVRIAELDGAANRSQPIRVETNRTSSAAGSDR